MVTHNPEYRKIVERMVRLSDGYVIEDVPGEGVRPEKVGSSSVRRTAVIGYSVSDIS